mgnify:CR=1 FL=1
MQFNPDAGGERPAEGFPPQLIILLIVIASAVIYGILKVTEIL